MTTGYIESRVRALDARAVEQLLEYQRGHVHRVQVTMLLEHRLEALRSGDAEPSGGDPTLAPEVAQGEAGGSKVSPVTQGPKQNPPSQGVPTNPAQPRT
jgi:hypothetical protein